MAMATAKMDADALQKFELNYELAIRKDVNVRRSYVTRRQRLKALLKDETDPLAHQTVFEYLVDKSEVTITLTWLNSMWNEEKHFPSNRLVECESRSLHAQSRLSRMEPPNAGEQEWVNVALTRLQEMSDSLNNSYTENADHMPEQEWEKYSEYSDITRISGKRNTFPSSEAEAESANKAER